MKLDIVVPLYNEVECASVFVKQVLAEFSRDPSLALRLLLVDDGSFDGTPEVLAELAKTDHRISVITLLGNHGHQKALIAGLDHCEGDAVLMMDGDGQHPSETAVEMVRHLQNNPSVDVVQGLRRGKQAGFIKNMTSKFFYWMINCLMPDARLVPGASDFRVVRKSALVQLRQYPDRYRNLRVLLASLKLPTAYMEYELARRIAGESRYNLRKMISLATDGWFAFSLAPLRLSLLLMLGSFLIVFTYLIYVVCMYISGETVSGWASLIALIIFMFSAVFGVLAIISEYVARIYTDVRRYPIYRIKPDCSVHEKDR